MVYPIIPFDIVPVEFVYVYIGIGRRIDGKQMEKRVREGIFKDIVRK